MNISKKNNEFYYFNGELKCEDCMGFENRYYKELYKEYKITNISKFKKEIKQKIKDTEHIVNCLLNRYGFEHPKEISNKLDSLIKELIFFNDEIKSYKKVLSELNKGVKK